MRKIFSLILIMLLLTGCTVKNYTPNPPVVLEECATVSLGDFSFDCKICRNEQYSLVTVQNTNAKGLSMKYDGSELTFSYNDFTDSFKGRNNKLINIAVIIYDVFEAIKATDVVIKKVENGFKYYGELPQGAFVLNLNDENKITQIEVRMADVLIKFK